MPFDMKTLALDTTAATSSTILFGAINGQTDTQPIPIPINIVGTYTQANFGATTANPTGTVGLTAVNGSATTVMRSDGAPALSQSIAPTWTGQHIFNNAITQLGAASQLQWSTDTILTRPAAATFQFGAADAAAPVAQTLSAQSVVTGTSNTAGADWTINASRGTGTGAGGRFIFQVAAAGGSGSSQNALAAAFTIGSDSSITTPLGYNAALGQFSSGFGYRIGAQAGLYAPDNTIMFLVSGTSAMAAVLKGNNSTNGVGIDSANTLSWGSLGSAQDLLMGRAAAATLRLGAADGASPVAQTLQVQNVAAGNSNVNGANWTLNGSLSTGTGTSGDIIVQTGGTGAGATSQNALVAAMTVKGATQQVILATNLRINVAPTVNGSASTTITSGADSSTNLGHRISFNLNGTTYWIPCGSVAF